MTHHITTEWLESVGCRVDGNCAFDVAGEYFAYRTMVADVMRWRIVFAVWARIRKPRFRIKAKGVRVE